GYVPTRTPLDKDWIVVEGDAKVVVFAQPDDPPGDGYLRIDTKQSRFAMDRLIAEPGLGTDCKRIEFTAQMPSDSLIHAGVWLNDMKGRRIRSGKDNGIFWLTYRIGDTRRAPTRDDRYPNEVAVWISGTLIAPAWRACSLRLPEDVARAYPGLVYSELTRIRLRNSLAISP